MPLRAPICVPGSSSWPRNATRWLQRKVWRQAQALDALNRRVVAQRFVLRTLDGLGRSLSAAEFASAKAAIADARLRDRIGEARD